jgi:Calcium-binding EGF domain
MFVDRSICICLRPKISACDTNAICNSATDSCFCGSGFLGNGTVCVDVDECNGGTSPCGPNSSCANTVGGFLWICNFGYSGIDGKNCVDANECTSGLNNCNPQETCTNTIGSFSCSCN